MKCDNCNKQATVHLTEIKNGKKIEKHLCEQCAAANEGLPVKSHTPINELLTNFVMAHSGLQKDLGTACESCGMSWAECRRVVVAAVSPPNARWILSSFAKNSPERWKPKTTSGRPSSGIKLSRRK